MKGNNGTPVRLDANGQQVRIRHPTSFSCIALRTRIDIMTLAEILVSRSTQMPKITSNTILPFLQISRGCSLKKGSCAGVPWSVSCIGGASVVGLKYIYLGLSPLQKIFFFIPFSLIIHINHYEALCCCSGPFRGRRHCSPQGLYTRRRRWPHGADRWW